MAVLAHWAFCAICGTRSRGTACRTSCRRRAARPVTPAGVGDLCILLAPDAVSDAVRRYQAALQEVYGGRPVDLVHLTLLRCCKGPVVNHLDALVRDGVHFDVEILELLPFYSGSRGVRVLKAKVRESGAIETWQLRLRHAARRAGVVPYEDLPWPTVTLLEDTTSEAENFAGIAPQPFFTATRVLLTEIVGPQEYRTLLDLAIPHHKSPG